jgi:hypothetical protein
MMTGFTVAWILADQLEDLREPYRQNAIAWLETCTQRSFRTPRSDLLSFLEDLHPLVRANFLHYTASVLQNAVRYFGGGGNGQSATRGRADGEASAVVL